MVRLRSLWATTVWRWRSKRGTWQYWRSSSRESRLSSSLLCQCDADPYCGVRVLFVVVVNTILNSLRPSQYLFDQVVVLSYRYYIYTMKLKRYSIQSWAFPNSIKTYVIFPHLQSMSGSLNILISNIYNYVYLSKIFKKLKYKYSTLNFTLKISSIWWMQSLHFWWMK